MQITVAIMEKADVVVPRHKESGSWVGIGACLSQSLALAV